MTARIVFLCSGGGGNLKFVHAAIRAGWLGDAELAAVVADRPCGALAFAVDKGLDGTVADFSDEGQREIAWTLASIKPAVVVTNVHRILGAKVLAACPGAFVNLHYSLLPAFSAVVGARPVRQALRYGAKFVGVTTHRVIEAVDMGAPLSQCAIPTEPGDTEATLMDLVFRCGCIALLDAIGQMLGTPAGTDPRLHRLLGRDVVFNPPPTFRPDFGDDDFWRSLHA